MATIMQNTSGEVIYLLPYHVFGRKRSVVNTYVAQKEVSSLHASVHWAGNDWVLKDLSRNGVWLNGEKMDKGSEVVLHKDMIINFSKIDSVSWLVTNLEGPKSLIYLSDNPHHSLLLEKYNLLPEEDNANAVVFFESTDNHWYYQVLDVAIETTNKVLLKHGDTLKLNEQYWNAFLPEPQDKTKEIDGDCHPLEDYKVNFIVSLNEEYISIEFCIGSQVITIPFAQHNYLLLLLARERIKHSASGLSLLDQGWMNTDIVCHELHGNETYMNLHIFRMRKLLSQKLLMINVDNIIERRRGEVRTGILVENIQIKKGNAYTALMKPQAG